MKDVIKYFYWAYKKIPRVLTLFNLLMEMTFLFLKKPCWEDAGHWRYFMARKTQLPGRACRGDCMEEEVPLPWLLWRWRRKNGSRRGAQGTVECRTHSKMEYIIGWSWSTSRLLRLEPLCETFLQSKQMTDAFGVVGTFRGPFTNCGELCDKSILWR